MLLFEVKSKLKNKLNKLKVNEKKTTVKFKNKTSTQLVNTEVRL